MNWYARWSAGALPTLRFLGIQLFDGGPKVQQANMKLIQKMCVKGSQ
jgi:hypothetical protein